MPWFGGPYGLPSVAVAGPDSAEGVRLPAVPSDSAPPVSTIACEGGRGYAEGMIRVTRSIAVAEGEIRLAFLRASGPGGQHVNKVATPCFCLQKHAWAWVSKTHAFASRSRARGVTPVGAVEEANQDLLLSG